MLGVNRKNIYYASVQDEKDTQLKQVIENVWTKHPSYGHKRLGMHLKINHKRVLRVMNKYGIKPPRRKKQYYCTRSVPHRKYANLIKNFTPSKPHALWCSDVSFLKYQGKFWYLITIVDVLTRQVVAADIGKYHTSALVLSCIKQAITNTQQTPYIFHSDQGTEFMAKKCTDYLKSCNIKVSASDKASPWQNGYQESFFGRFKDEFGDINRFETIGELIEEIYHHIHYYNTQRIHTALKMPPSTFATSLRNLSELMGT